MSDVSAKVVLAAVDTARSSGLAAGLLVNDLGLGGRNTLRTGRVDWDRFAEFAARLERAYHGRGGLQRFVEDLRPQVAELAQTTTKLLGLRPFLELVLTLSASAFAVVRFDIQEPAPGVLVVSLRLPLHVRDCPAFFRVAAEVLRTFPRQLGLPEVKVATTLKPRSAELRISVAPTKGARAGGRNRAAGRDRSRHELKDPDGKTGWEGAAEVEKRLQRAADQWHLTGRQQQVLRLVAAGRTNKQVAAELSCAPRTVEVHITQLLRKSRTTGRGQLIAQFWSMAA